MRTNRRFSFREEGTNTKFLVLEVETFGYFSLAERPYWFPLPEEKRRVQEGLSIGTEFLEEL
jgi:hypothetical protein